jgi:two-component system LytT family sensor kinase
MIKTKRNSPAEPFFRRRQDGGRPDPKGPNPQSHSSCMERHIPTVAAELFRTNSIPWGLMAARIFHMPRYSGKDGTVLLSSMGPLAILLNLFLYGNRYFTEPLLLLEATVLTFFFLAGTYLLFTRIGVLLANRFPGSGQIYRRMVLALSLFLLSDFVILSLLLRGYDYFSFFGYQYAESDLVIVYCFTATITVFLTFLNEGIARFETYKRTLRETEQLRHTYLQSQLMGLKSQVNPHFLFNSLNTLSSLIPENPESAETFLDELSKVYRYLLRNNEDYLVPLSHELTFLRSFAYLLQERYGAAFQLETKVDSALNTHLLPPLTMQFIIDDILEQNSFSRDEPVTIRIYTDRGNLLIQNNQQKRITGSRELTGEAVLDNLREKFRLISGQEITITESGASRSVSIPLLHESHSIWNRQN